MWYYLTFYFKCYLVEKIKRNLAGHLDQFYIQFQIILSNNKETAVELSTSHNLF